MTDLAHLNPGFLHGCEGSCLKCERLQLTPTDVTVATDELPRTEIAMDAALMRAMAQQTAASLDSINQLDRVESKADEREQSESFMLLSSHDRHNCSDGRSQEASPSHALSGRRPGSRFTTSSSQHWDYSRHLQATGKTVSTTHYGRAPPEPSRHP